MSILFNTSLLFQRLTLFVWIVRKKFHYFEVSFRMFGKANTFTYTLFCKFIWSKQRCLVSEFVFLTFILLKGSWFVWILEYKRVKKKFQTTPLFTRPNSKIRKNQRLMKSVGLKKKFTFDKSFYFISFLGLGSPLLEKERQILFPPYWLFAHLTNFRLCYQKSVKHQR